MMKKLAGSIRQYRRHTILAPVYVALEVVMEVVIPILMANLIDYGIDDGNMLVVVKVGVALLVSALMSLVFGVLSGRSAAIASAGYAANLREDLYHKVQDFSFSNIDRFSGASLVTRLTTDVTNVQNAFQMIIRMAVRSPMLLVSSLVVCFSINARLALIFLACVPILGVGLYLVIKHAHPTLQRVFKTYDKLNSVVQENLHGIRVVKSFVREEHEVAKFQGISEQIKQGYTKAEKTIAFNMPLMQLCMYACMLLISWFGARIIVASGGTALSTGQLMSLMTYATQILVSLMLLSMVMVMITIARASAERIVEVLDEESDLQNGENPLRELAGGDIRFENVSFRYGQAEKASLRSINLDIGAGETVGILGGTGSAKSTLVQLIPRLYDVSEGRVLVGGQDVRDYDLDTLRGEVAMVLQQNVLFSGSIKENLRWGDATASDEELERVCRLAQADGFVRAFPEGYDTHVEQGGSNLSGGQKQRLCIARALLGRPRILILDDSTSAVDTKTDALIRRSLREELPGTTKLIIAQRVSSVRDADKIIVMDDGMVSAVGRHEELLETSDIYREVYESQQKGESADESEGDEHDGNGEAAACVS